jgi:hypothetical protein
LRQIKIISFKDKDQWELCPKYNIGNKWTIKKKHAQIVKKNLEK